MIRLTFHVYLSIRLRAVRSFQRASKLVYEKRREKRRVFARPFNFPAQMTFSFASRPANNCVQEENCSWSNFSRESFVTKYVANECIPCENNSLAFDDCIIVRPRYAKEFIGTEFLHS